jgi:hypothetical protein
MSNEIPTKVREDVRARDDGKCIVCGALGTEMMHRIPRRDGGHSRANLALGCRTCHAKAHREPLWGFEVGITVSRYVDAVSSIAIRSWRGWLLLNGSGGYTVIAPRTVLPADLAPYLVTPDPPED